MNIFVYACFNLSVVAAIFASVFWGNAGVIFENDHTYLTYAIAAWAFVAVASISVKAWRFVDSSRSFLVFLGLIGTVIGFMISLSGIDPSTASDPSSAAKMVSTLLSGLGTALGTTLVGAVGSVWLSINKLMFFRPQKED